MMRWMMDAVIDDDGNNINRKECKQFILVPGIKGK
jgi:hypothetical protein